MAMKTWDEAEENKKKKKVNDSSPVLPMIVSLSLFSFFLFNNPMNIRERSYVYKIEVCSQWLHAEKGNKREQLPRVVNEMASWDRYLLGITLVI